LTVNNPPVNALSRHVRQGLHEGLIQVGSDAAVQAVVITCAGRTFIAGADITEFGKPPTEPSLHSVLDLIENCPKPVVAAIHGTALGGGLEVTLACHYRMGVKGARFGLPEVKLGLLPGAGGTQRLPRVVGAQKASPSLRRFSPRSGRSRRSATLRTRSLPRRASPRSSRSSGSRWRGRLAVSARRRTASRRSRPPSSSPSTRGSSASASCSPS
jgi:hypothetical protein